MWPATLRSFFILFVITQSVSFTIAQAPIQTVVKAPARLEAGKSVDSELNGGETASFTISLQINQLLDLTVHQRGIDVAVTLLAPDGRPAAQIDSPNGSNGPEPIVIISEKGGEYLLKVESLEKGATPGRYEIRINALRDSTANDRDRVAGLKMYFEALELEQRRDEASVRKAIELYEMAAPVLHKADDLKTEAEALNNIGLLYHELGESDRGLSYLARSLSLSREIGRSYTEAETLINIGAAYDNLSEPQKALDYYSQAVKILNGAHPDIEAVALNNIGKIYTLLGEHHKAIDHFQRSIELKRKMGDRSTEHYPLINLGAAYSAMGESNKAIETYQTALEFARKANDFRVEAMILNNIGRGYTSINDQPKALEFLTRSLELRRKSGDRNGQVSTLNNLGVVYDAMGQREKGKEYLKQALELSRSIGDKFTEARTLFSLAGFERQDNNLVGAKDHLESAITNLESYRTKLASLQSRTSFFSTMQNYYGAYITTLMELHRLSPSAGYDALGLEANERARARALLEILTEAEVDIRQGANPQLLEREKRLQKDLNDRAALQTRVSNDKNASDQAATLRNEIAALSSEFSDVQTQIRRNSARYATLIEPAPLTVAELQRDVLDPGTVLLEYALGVEKSYLWVVTSTSINSFELPKRSEIEPLSRRVHDLLNRRQGSSHEGVFGAQYTAAAEQLGQMVLGPAASQLKGKRLLIVSDGALQYVPFGALPNPTLYSQTSRRAPTANASWPSLVETNEIVNIPSVSALRVLRRDTASRTPAAKSMAVFADPVFTASDERVGSVRAVVSKATTELRTRTLFERAYNFDVAENTPLPISRLPFTRREADAIVSTAPANSWLKATDFTASRATVTESDLSKYRIVHFATHGILHGEHPELSGIVLSLVNEKGEPVNGFLRLNEIYDLKLNADLVVLSACQTALGKDIRGEGLIGLTRGFMYAGSPRVVASLWKVDDVATAELMKIFYQKMLKEKMRPAAALRAAKIDMMKQKRWASPYFWAAFELQGEWR